ncbi:MAG: acyl-CoA dehydrogenase family protein [Nitrososphaerales archaeon]
MQYKLSQEQELLKQTIGELAQSEVSPLASKIDWEATVPADLMTKLPNFGLYGITIPQEYGGAGADFLTLVLAIEELCKASGSLGAQISFHNAVVSEALMASSNSTLKSTLLPKLASGTLGAFSINPKSTISCKMENNQILLNGSSEYVMNAASAGIFLVLAKMNDGNRAIVCFSKEQSESEFEVGPIEKLLGMRASQTASISFHNLRLPADALVFEPQQTGLALSQLLARSRLAVAAQALGIAQASLDAEIQYSNERSQFNTKIGSFYAVKDYIAQDEIVIQSARSITYSVAAGILSNPALLKDSAIAKVSASNSAVQAARHSIRVHGGYGFIRDYPVERYLRDGRVTQIYIESNESLKAEIANSLLGT